MTLHRLSLALPLLGFLVLSGAGIASAMPSPTEVDLRPLTMDEAIQNRMRLAQTQPSPSPSPAPLPQAQGAPASAAPATADEPIGNVATLTGTATVIRRKDSIALKLKDDIFLNDTVQTAAGSSLGITFNDATTFHLSANARITIDSYVYEEGGNKNTGLFDIGKGTVAFVAASLAKTGDMQITTPTATLGIRGTTGLVEVPEGTAATSANNVNIKLYPDADGRVGRIEVNDRQGARLGALTQGASGFSIRPGTAGARVAAVPLAISPQQAARDQGFVRQVHAAQTVGRQIVTEQRAIRRATPPGQPQPPRQPGQPQPGQQRPGQPQPGQNRPGQPSPGTPNRQGQQKQLPGVPQPPQPGQPGQQPRTGQGPQPGVQGQPALLQPRPGGLQQRAPGVQRPQLRQPRPAAPKEKQKKRRPL